ncbi:MAG TPA: hypothetical protein VGQ38_01065 [Gaiellaceae bacterium]|nr:hypothetical protein [Gaiellaceae bacterium]
MPGRWIVALILLSAAAFVAAVHKSSAESPLYTRGATQSCLTRLPNAVSGLPPAKPPAPSLLFAYALARDDVDVLTMAITGPPPRAHTQLVAWYGVKRAYQGIVLSFFKSAADARASEKPIDGAKLTGNVVATWAQKPIPNQSLRNEVFGCLRSEPVGGSAEPSPPASLATFVGAWGGHTRGLSIAPNGSGSEFADDGCCTRSYQTTFQILSVRGTVTRAEAVYRVISFARHENEVKARHKGDLGKLLLRNGIVTNTLTGVYFCSDPAWGTTGACGA